MSDAPHGSGPDYGALHRLYARYAASYDRRFARYSEGTLERTMQLLGDAAPGRVVDVACGTGLLAERIRRCWPQSPIIGVDLSPEMLAVAAARMPPSASSASTPSTDWRIGPAEALPVEDGWANTLTCTNAFHLVQQPEAALREFLRVLAAGGRLILVDWTRDFASMRALLMTLRVVRRQRRIAWSEGGLQAAIEDAGFAVERVDRFKLGPVWGLMAFVARKENG